jgi:hypothetical protein
VIAPYDYEALWVKSKLFLNRAMDGRRTFDECALWASAALELLGKAALAKASPLLIAEPTEEGVNMLIALGMVEGEARFSSVSAKTIWARCGRAFKPFNPKEAALVSENRNEYLHGSGVGFNAIPEAVWWPRYWAQVSILVAALDEDMDALVGSSRASIVEEYLSQNEKNLDNRVQAAMARARQRLAQRESPHVSARAHRELSMSLELEALLDHRSSADCPVCGDAGVIEGSEIDESNVEWERLSDEDWQPIVTLTITAEYFSCANCQLVLDGIDSLSRADLPDSFVVPGEYTDIYEPEYGND